MRPAALCADDTPHLPVMQHAVEWMRDEQRYEPDWVMILMPTSPFRRPVHIVESLANQPGIEHHCVGTESGTTEK